MAQQVYTFAVQIPAGTQQTDGWSQDLAMPPCIVSQIDIRVPPGPRGCVGFAIGAADVPVLPVNQGGWIIADDEAIHWPLDSQIESGAWQFFAYNVGDYPHTTIVSFQTSPAATDQAATVQPVTVEPE